MTTPMIALFTKSQELAHVMGNSLQGNADLHRYSRPLRELVRETDDVRPDVLIVDLTRTSSGGHAEDRLLGELYDHRPRLPVVMLTGKDCPEPLARRTACTELIHVCDSQPWKSLMDTVNALCHLETGGHESTGSDNSESDTTASQSPDSTHSQMILSGLTRQFETNSTSLNWMLQDLEVAAKHDVTLLLVGETGVGKTYLARLIHEVSPRCTEPFVNIACGALPGELLESELFGHKKGAFTGAYADKDGKFVAAGRGTMLLDEIDVLSPEQQVKLLRVIETGEFEPLGSNQTITRQARLVVASNLALQPLVEQGRFRADLFYRLNIMKFEIPPLRERREDIAPLMHKLIAQLSAHHHVKVEDVDPAVLPVLESYPWPGNVRELENVLRRAVIFCRNGVLRPEHLPRQILDGEPGPGSDSSLVFESSQPTAASSPTLGGQIETTEREIIRKTLVVNNQSRTKTAKQLGISRVTLYNKMRKYSLS